MLQEGDVHNEKKPACRAVGGVGAYGAGRPSA